MSDALPLETIKKHPGLWSLQPNLLDYENSCAGFCWDEVGREFDWLPNGKGLNIAHEAVDRHAEMVTGDRLAMRWLGQGGAVLDFTYCDLKRLSNRFANVLRGLGLGKGDTVCVLIVFGLRSRAGSPAPEQGGRSGPGNYRVELSAKSRPLC